MSNITDNIVDSLTNNVLYPQDTLLSAALGLSLVTFSGFKWFMPSKIDIIKCEYSPYTVYNQQISNSTLIKQNTVSITGTRQFDELNTFTTNIISNTLLLKLLRSYIKEGGMFMLVTSVGIIQNLSVTELSVSNENGPQAMFTFNFIQQNVDEYLKSNTKALRNTICL